MKSAAAMPLPTLLVLAAAACLSCSSAGPPASVGQARGARVEEGLTHRIDALIRARMEERRIPGLALSIVRDGETVLLKGYGVADLQSGASVTAETVFDISSVTKTFTAAAVMRLAGSGRVSIDRPVRDHLPEAPESWSSMTVRQLLTHTSGLAETDVPTVNGAWLADYTTSRMLEHAFAAPLAAAPGERFLYSDLGYFLLGVIIERVTGVRYGDFLRAAFFEPFEMRATTVLDQYAIVPRKADTYFLRERQLARNRRYVQVELPSAYGLLTSALDLTRWESAMARGRVVSSSSLAAMAEPSRTSGGAPAGYGLGWVVGTLDGRRTVGHAGGTGTYYLRVPDERLAVIVLTNLAVRALEDGRARPNGSNPREIAETVAGMFLGGPG